MFIQYGYIYSVYFTYTSINQSSVQIVIDATSSLQVF